MDSTINTLKTVELGHPDQAQYSIIWLHGLGADGNDFVPLVPELGLPALTLEHVHFVFPHAPVRPVSLNGGMPMRAWFDLYSLDESGPIDEDGINEAVSHIHRLIDKEIERGIQSENIILAGFSQGGYIALLSALFYPKRLGGVIGLSTFLWPPHDFEQRRQPCNQHIPLFLAHGNQDQLVQLKYGEQMASLLTSLGYTLSFQVYPMAHSVCPEEVKALSLWLQKQFIH